MVNLLSHQCRVKTSQIIYIDHQSLFTLLQHRPDPLSIWSTRKLTNQLETYEQNIKQGDIHHELRNLETFFCLRLQPLYSV